MKQQTLTGAWDFRQAGDEAWLPATVPGGVHTDLLALGRIPDPFVADNEKRVMWVAEQDWQYRRTFTVDAALQGEEKFFLVCDGLDTLAEVMLNGQLLDEKTLKLPIGNGGGNSGQTGARPVITSFSACCATVNGAALNARSALVPVTWTATNRPVTAHERANRHARPPPAAGLAAPRGVAVGGDAAVAGRRARQPGQPLAGAERFDAANPAAR